MDSPLRIAMWSGPRNVSTALMRAFDSRPDTVVCDEPLYAHYLAVTGHQHPMADEIVRRGTSDWRAVAAQLTGPLPAGRRVFYQKHMAQHLLPVIERGWLADLTNAFLIRDPRQMLTSFLRVIPEPTLEETGYPQQAELFEAERERTGSIPLVIDSKDLLLDPSGVLRALCEGLGLVFDEAMLSWDSGTRETDGCWAEAWYGHALGSTGFAPYRAKSSRVGPAFRDLEDRCVEFYDRLYAHRLSP